MENIKKNASTTTTVENINKNASKKNASTTTNKNKSLSNVGAGNKLVRKVGSIRIWIAIISAMISGIVFAYIGGAVIARSFGSVEETFTIVSNDDDPNPDFGCWVQDKEGKVMAVSHLKTTIPDVKKDLGCVPGKTFKAERVYTDYGAEKMHLKKAPAPKEVGYPYLVVSLVCFLVAYAMYRFRRSTTLAASLLVSNIVFD